MYLWKCGVCSKRKGSLETFFGCRIGSWDRAPCCFGTKWALALPAGPVPPLNSSTGAQQGTMLRCSNYSMGSPMRTRVPRASFGSHLSGPPFVKNMRHKTAGSIVNAGFLTAFSVDFAGRAHTIRARLLPAQFPCHVSCP